MNEEAAISEVYRKIDREKAIINAANQMRQATNNASVNSRVDSQIRDARRNIQYFEQTLQDLRSRKMGGDMQNMSLNAGNGGPTPPAHGSAAGQQQAGGMPPRRDVPGSYAGAGDYGAPGPGGYSMGGGHGLMPPRAPYAPPNPAERTPRARPTYSKLGMFENSRACVGFC